MSHLDTAYQLGTKQAEADFDVEVQKLSAPVDLGAAKKAPVQGGGQIIRGQMPAPVKRPAPQAPLAPRESTVPAAPTRAL